MTTTTGQQKIQELLRDNKVARADLEWLANAFALTTTGMTDEELRNRVYSQVWGKNDDFNKKIIAYASLSGTFPAAFAFGTPAPAAPPPPAVDRVKLKNRIAGYNAEKLLHLAIKIAADTTGMTKHSDQAIILAAVIARIDAMTDAEILLELKNAPLVGAAPAAAAPKKETWKEWRTRVIAPRLDAGKAWYKNHWIAFWTVWAIIAVLFVCFAIALVVMVTNMTLQRPSDANTFNSQQSAPACAQRLTFQYQGKTVVSGLEPQPTWNNQLQSWDCHYVGICDVYETTLDSTRTAIRKDSLKPGEVCPPLH